MHVDGFRFDLASAMARDEDGEPMEHPPVLWGIELSTELAGSKIIAEAWDAAGLYHVGSFPGYRWMEWNGKYRDSLRRACAATRAGGGVATRIAGSSDLYQRQPAPPHQQHQLRHLPRRLHAGGPGRLQPQAQRGQRREGNRDGW
jgi:isoamylase